MTTLAVIKNELFKDYLKIVSTNNLEETLDNPDVPVPFTCVDSVNNNNSDALANQLYSYFNSAKVKNKEFFVLDEGQLSQLSFMLNLIKVSSGEVGNEVQNEVQIKASNNTNTINNHNNTINNNTADNVNVTAEIPEVAPVVVPEVNPVTPVEPSVSPDIKEVEPVITNEPEVKVETPVEAPVIVETPPEVKETQVKEVKDKEEVAVGSKVSSPAVSLPPQSEDEPFDPFAFAPPVDAPVSAQEVKKPVVEIPPPVSIAVKAEEKVVTPSLGEIIPSLGVPKNATLHFSKNDKLTATIVDEQTAIFEGTTQSLTEAAKAAFKKSGTLGMANGLSNWLYEGKTLRELKEAQLM